MNHRLLFKKILSKVFVDSEKSTIRKIKKESIEVVSFDLFDTLVYRNVSDHDYVFELLEQNYNDFFCRKDEIRSIRIEAEKKARKNYNNEEITLGLIYAEFPDEYKDKIQWLMKKEIDLETNICERNSILFRIYNEAVRKQKKIYIISDTYLPKSCLEMILKKTGYTEYMGIYASSEFGYTKRTSKLYKSFHQDNHYAYNNHLHIGDALISDFFVPFSLKIHVSLIGKRQNRASFVKKNNSSKLDCDILQNYISNTSRYTDYYQRLGYEVVGPLLYGYVLWLQRELQKHSISKVFFLAREGILLNLAFEKFYRNSKEFSSREITHKVLRVSRVATSVPLGDYTDSIQQKEYITGYLNDNDFCGNIAVADVGWRGTIQNNLQEIIGDNANIQGFYYGILKKNNILLITNANAYAFGPRKNKSNNLFDVVMAAPSLFELFFLSTDGTTKSYNEKFEPVIAQPDQRNEINEKISRLQEASLVFVEEFSKMIENLGVNLKFDAECVFEPYDNMIRNKSGDLIKYFSDFNHVDNSSIYFLPVHNLLWYLIRPKEFIKDFKQSGAKALFLKKIIRIRFPYIETVSLVRKIFD